MMPNARVILVGPVKRLPQMAELAARVIAQYPEGKGCDGLLGVRLNDDSTYSIRWNKESVTVRHNAD